jgi:phage FluMu gp28-like protein
MKKFKNLESYTEATQYIQNIFDVPVSQMELEEAQEEEIIAKIIWLFDNAKNSAVRAAIHHHALGNGVYLDTSEEKEISKYVHYKGMFCEYFNQSRQYAQLKCYDGSNKTLRYLTEVATYIVDDAGEEHFTLNNYLKKYNPE